MDLQTVKNLQYNYTSIYRINKCEAYSHVYIASVDVVIELFKTKFMPILLYGSDACPVGPQQLRSLNHVVVSYGRKMFNVNTSEIAAGCLKMFGVCDVAEAMATR